MKIGIVGGSGLDDPDIIKDLEKQHWTTPYGDTMIKSGQLNGVDVVFVPRHGLITNSVPHTPIIAPIFRPSRIWRLPILSRPMRVAV